MKILLLVPSIIIAVNLLAFPSSLVIFTPLLAEESGRLERQSADSASDLLSANTARKRQGSFQERHWLAISVASSFLAILIVLLAFLLAVGRKAQGRDTHANPQIDYGGQRTFPGQTQTHMLEGEERYRVVADFAFNWEYWLGSDGQFRYISPSVERITGYSADDFVGAPDLFERIMHPEDKVLYARHLADCENRESRDPHELQFRIIRQDGSVVWIEHTCRAVYLADGTYGGQRASNRDITARKLAEERLQTAERQFRAILEASTESVFLMDRDGKLLVANRTTADRLGTDLETLSGKNIYDLLPPDVAERRKRIVQQVLETAKPVRFEDERSAQVFLNSVRPIVEPDGKINHLAVFGRDITEEKRVKAEIEESTRKLSQANLMFQLVIDTIPLRIFWKDRNLIYLGCNRLFAADAGREDPSELLGDNDYHMSWKEQADLYRKDDLDVMLADSPKINYEERQTAVDGNLIWILTSKVPLKDVEGNVIGILGTYDDITERKLMEARLRESEERYRNLFRNNHAVQLVIDPETGQIIDANPAACRYYGYDRSTFKTMNVSSINTLSPDQILEEMARARAEQRNRFYFSHRLANGEVRPVEVYSGPIMLMGRQVLYSIIHDISERKKAEEEKEKLILELQDALSSIRVLRGMITICSSCKKIFNDKGQWEQMEMYIRDHSEAEFSHGICPGCAEKLYPDFFKKVDE